MVKLLRLTSRSNDGVFKNNLQNNLILKPNSSIALLNLTFNTKFSNLFVDDDNNQINFSGSIKQNFFNLGWQQPYIQQLLPSREFVGDSLRFTEFLTEVQNTLNSTLDAIPTQRRTFIYPWNTVYSEFYIPKFGTDVLYDPLVEIHFRFSMLITPLGGQGIANDDPFEGTQNETMWSQSQTLDNNGGGVDNFNLSILNNTAELQVGLGNGIASSTRHRLYTNTKKLWHVGQALTLLELDY